LLAFATACGGLGEYPLRGQCVLSFVLKTKLAKLNFLVADERDMLSLLVPKLYDMGVETIHRATAGPAALKLLHQTKTRIDIVICDWDLPKISGLEVLKFVRKKYGGKPFLMLSSQVTRESIATAAKHGVNGYLAKPFTMQRLEKRIEGLLYALPEIPLPEPEKSAPDDPTDQEDWEI